MKQALEGKKVREDIRYGLQRVYAVVAPALLAGCVAVVPVGPVPVASIPSSEKLSFPIALYFEHDLKNHVEEVSLSTIHGARKTYRFQIGAGMASALEAQMRKVFSRVEVSSVQPTSYSLRESGLDGVMRVAFKRSDIDIQVEPDILYSRAKTSCQIELDFSFQDTEGKEVLHRTVVGQGTSSARTAYTDDSAFVSGIDRAIENALGQLTRDVIAHPDLREWAKLAQVRMLKSGVVNVASVVNGNPKQGTGFIVQRSGNLTYIVTAAHVIEGDKQPKIGFFTQSNLPISSKVVRREGDVALLMVTEPLPSGVLALRLAPSARLNDGDDVNVIGSPVGMVGWSIIRGNISSQGKENIYFPGGINEGNSGGPVIKSGEVVGLVVAETSLNGPQRYGIAISSPNILRFLEASGVHGTKEAI